MTLPLRLTLPGLIALLVAGTLVAVGLYRFFDKPELVTLAQVTPAAPGPETRLGAFNPARIYSERSPGTVTLQAAFGSRSVGGSGFVVDHDGHIITSAHVVSNAGGRAQRVFVDFASRDRVEGTVLGIDLFSDIAVVKVDPDESALKPVPLGNSDKVLVGEPVAAIGSPFGNEGSLSVGVVSAAHRSIPAVVSNYTVEDAIQTDAAINQGNSGGPLFNARGEVIGVNAQIRSTSGNGEGVGFAIPINTVKRSLRQIVAEGRVRYAYMGLRTTTVTPQMAADGGLPVPRGALVSWLRSGGPAALAGLSSGSRTIVSQGQQVTLGDQIVAIGGQQVYSSEDVSRAILRLNVGDAVKVEFFRGKQRHVAQASLVERPIS